MPSPPMICAATSVRTVRRCTASTATGCVTAAATVRPGGRRSTPRPGP
jgi:H+/gluconate symporter-like permease